MKILFILFFLFIVICNCKTISTSYTGYEINNDNKLSLISDYLKEYYFITGFIEKMEFIVDSKKNTTCLTLKSNDIQNNLSHKSYYEYSDIFYDNTVMKIVDSLMSYFNVGRIDLFSIEKKNSDSITDIYATIY